MELFDRIKELGGMHGIDLIGVAGIGRYNQEIERMGGALPGGFPRAISIGIVLQRSIVDLLADRTRYENLLQYRTHAYDVINDRLDSFASIIGSLIQKSGFRAMPVPAAKRIDHARICASISHKMTARLAGFGWIGKSCLLIHPVYGPGVRWTTVLTNAPFEENQSIVEGQCGGCDRCVKACPVQAFTGRAFSEQEPRDARMDAAKCEGYFAEFERLNKLPVCGMCLYVCPHGKTKRF